MTHDSIVNLLTGRGTSVDRTSHNFWHHIPMPPEQIEAAYRSSWLMSKIVDLPAMDMVREWREWELDAEEIKKVEEAEKRLGVRQAILTGLIYGRLGGGVVILGSGTDMAAPARDSDKLLYVKALPRRVIGLGETDWDVTSENFGEPAWFTINGARGSDRIHPSRVIVFKGERVPGLTGLTSEEQFWGDSVIERIDRAVKNADTATDGFATLIDEAKIDYYKLAELANLLLQPGGLDKARARVEAMNMAKSTHRAVIMDAGDDWEQRQINWAGMPDMIKTYLAIVAGAADIPATRLLGKSPDGMNSTGESDEKNYRASIATKQDMTLRPALDKLDRLLLPGLGIASDTYWDFCPLDTPTEKERAEVENKEADTYTKLVNAGFPEGPLTKSMAARMVDSGNWPELGDELAKMPEIPEADPNLPDPSALVARAKGGGQSSRGVGGSIGSGSPSPAQDAFFADAQPRPLYVQRKLLNAGELIAWAKANGFKSTLAADDMHVTVLFSRTPVDPMKMGDSWTGDDEGRIRIKPGGPRAIERLGESAVVLLFSSWEIESRHRSMVEAGGSHDFDTYQPHITLSYEVPAEFDLEAVKPFSGALEFGPEIFEPLDLDWKSKVTEA
ncbi:hypothetical protein JI59_18480 [Novosphingobium pentaromativorans US6-1]|nr:hypothetical protein JI59_18480 [Novosphingobium pentaromativorans US6-1]